MQNKPKRYRLKKNMMTFKKGTFFILVPGDRYMPEKYHDTHFSLGAKAVESDTEFFEEFAPNIFGL